jgi:hypothetical protein
MILNAQRTNNHCYVPPNQSLKLTEITARFSPREKNYLGK